MSRKPLSEVHGSCRICLQPTDAHPGIVTINGTAYVLHVHRRGYGLERVDGKGTYDLPADLSSCDCPDAVQAVGRPGGCKHRRALAAILAALDIDVSAPVKLAPALRLGERVSGPGGGVMTRGGFYTGD